MTKKEGVRDIDYALVAKAHTPMYLMHKYWARKPHNVVREYIEHYSKKGDIVLDPFCGSGPTPIEAIKAGRKAIGIDLDPIATFITRYTAMPIDLEKVKEAFEDLQQKCKEEILSLYKTECKECKSQATVLASIWERGTEEPLELRYYCEKCKGRNSKKPDKEDLKLIHKVEKMKIPYWYPTNRLYYNHSPFMKKEKSDTIPDLFTKRNLIALSILCHNLVEINNQNIRILMEFAFTSMVHLASKMCPVAKPGGRGHWSKFSATSFWALQSYWVPPLSMESNVWMLYESAVKAKQGILKGKKDCNKQIKFYKEAKKFKDLDDGANILIETHNALELTDIIPANTVDYVFTDPPYGGAVQYFELSTLWASWLKMNLDYKDEVTVNKNQDKDFQTYHKMLKAAFRQIYQVLKPGKYLTVTFHSTDIKVWNSIIKAVVMTGFDLEKIIYQPPARPSAKGLLQPYGSAVGDYYIRFRKPETEKIITEKHLDMKEYEMRVVDYAKHIIGERGEPTIYQHILNGIMVDLKGGRYAPIGARNIEDVLKSHVGKDFELIPVKDEKGKTIGHKWWVKGWDLSHFVEPVLSDRIERAIINVLDKRVKVSFDEILQAVFIEFPNAQTPDTQNIKEILKEYAEPTKDGKWRLIPGLSEEARTSIHNKMIYLLAMLGKKAGYKVWIGLNEQRQEYEGKPLSKLCDKIPTFRYVPQENLILQRIKQIDVLWLEDGRIRYEFEVENTTGITEAIIRGAHIPQEVLKTKRFIVIPKERESFLHKRLQEPIIQQSLQKINWKFMRYHELEGIYNKYKKKKTFNAKEIEKIASMPRKGESKQANLNDF